MREYGYMPVIIGLLVIIIGLSVVAYKVSQAPNNPPSSYVSGEQPDGGVLHNISDGATHLFGIKWIPVCKPMIGNATCGYDILYLTLLIMVVLFVVTIICWRKDLKNEHRSRTV